MADLGNPLSSLYPQPPSPSQNALAGNPMQLLPTIMDLQRFNAQRAVGQAFQGAVRPDGTFDQAAALNAIRDNPAAALAAPQGIQQGINAWDSSVIAGQHALDFNVGASNRAMDLAYPYLFKVGGMTDEDVYNYKAGLVREHMPPQLADQLGDALLNEHDLTKRQQMLYRWGTTRAGAGAAFTLQPSVDPNTAQPGYTTQAQATAGATLGGTGRGAPRPVVTGPAPNDAADTAAYNQDQAQGAAITRNIRPMQQALPIAQALTHWGFGKTAEGAQGLRSFAMGIGFTDPKIDPTLALQEEFGKYVNQFALSAGVSDTDKKLLASYSANPSQWLSQKANIDLIRKVIAQNMMDAARTKAYDMENPTAPADLKRGYQRFAGSFTQKYGDPDAYMWSQMQPEERQATAKRLGITLDNTGRITALPKPGSPQWPAYVRFRQSFDAAKTVVPPPGAVQ